MEMHQVRYFLAVCEELNFTRAAEKCNVAQPSLTRAIKLLEEELGGALFHRERANTHLSELGRMVRPYLEQVYAQAREAKQTALDFTKLRHTVLKLGIMCTIAPTHLVDLVGGVQARHPGIELQIVDDSANRLHERLIGGDLEVAIYCRPSHEPDERVHTTPLFREQMVIVLPPSHRLAMRNAIRLEDLKSERYLNRANCEFNDWPGRIFTRDGIGCSIVYRSERDDWILAMIAAGLGFGFMPEHCISHPGVVAAPVVEPELWREVNLVTERRRHHSPGVVPLVREDMRVRWAGAPALAVQTVRAASTDAEPAAQA